MHLSILIPLYNEATLITTVLDKLSNVRYPDFVEGVQLVVVDDASSDGSFNVVKAYAAGRSDILLHAHPVNRGKGAAVRTAAGLSAGDHLLIQDADLELDPHDIPALLQAIHELKVPFVNGSRYLPGVMRTQSAFKRYLANKLFTLLTSMLIDVHLTDMACGYKLMTKDLFNKLHLKEDRFGFEAELIIKCGRMRRNWIAEVPVHYHPRNSGEGKKLRNADGFRILRTILKYGLLRRP
ncbi:MAG TPA: glycosyltransferase family 2 protein [Flavobacteriales bacterium]